MITIIKSPPMNFIIRIHWKAFKTDLTYSSPHPAIHLFLNLFHRLLFLMCHFIHNTAIIHIANIRFSFHLLPHSIHTLRNHSRCPFHIKQSSLNEIRRFLQTFKPGLQVCSRFVLHILGYPIPLRHQSTAQPGRQCFASIFF